MHHYLCQCLFHMIYFFTGPKKQISKALKNLRRLYLSFPRSVVDVLLNFMTTHYISSVLIELRPGEKTTPPERNLQSLFDDWELAILKLSKKDTNFIFTFLEAVLGKIQGQYSEEHDIGIHLCPLFIISFCQF